jgi:hypothetical protein
MLPYGVENRRGILYLSSWPKSVEMTTYFYTKDEYLEAAQVFHWATKENYVMWFTGSTERHHRTEAILPRLAKNHANKEMRNRSLYSTPYGKRLIYICPRKKRKSSKLYKVDHGLACTDCMVRFARSIGEPVQDMAKKVVEERLYRGCGCIPDFGVWYQKKMLLVEYSTEDNFEQHNVIKEKLAAYRSHLYMINEKFNTTCILVFVIDITRRKLEQFVKEEMPIGLPAFFTDYTTFKTVPIGKQLSAPIYIWGEDGKTYPLTENAQL